MGSRATASSVSGDVLREHVPCSTGGGEVGDPQVRHRGTLGRLARPRRPGVRPPGHGARPRRHDHRPGPDGTHAIAVGRLLPRVPRDHARRRRDDHRGAGADVPACGVGVREVQPAGPGLGHRRRRRRRGRSARGGAGEHGLDARPGGVGRGHAPRRRERQRGRRAGQRGGRAVLGPQRLRGVSPSPRAGARAARARRHRRRDQAGANGPHDGSINATREDPCAALANGAPVDGTTERVVVEFDHTSPEYGAAHTGDHRRPRNRCPVAYSPNHDGYWVVAGYEASPRRCATRRRSRRATSPRATASASAA